MKLFSSMLKRPSDLAPGFGAPHICHWRVGHIGLGLLMLTFVFAASFSAAGTTKTRNVFLITTDGLRWQEVFSGAEELLLSKENGGVKDVDELKKDFWRPTPEDR